MLKNITDPQELRRILLSLLSTCGTLAGISLALVGIVNIKISNTKVESFADDMFLFSSFGFVLACYLIFFALRQINTMQLRLWTNIIDVVFLFSLTLLVIAGFMVVYTFV